MDILIENLDFMSVKKLPEPGTTTKSNVPLGYSLAKSALSRINWFSLKMRLGG